MFNSRFNFELGVGVEMEKLRLSLSKERALSDWVALVAFIGANSTPRSFAFHVPARAARPPDWLGARLMVPNCSQIDPGSTRNMSKKP